MTLVKLITVGKTSTNEVLGMIRETNNCQFCCHKDFHFRLINKETFIEINNQTIYLLAMTIIYPEEIEEIIKEINDCKLCNNGRFSMEIIR